MKTFCPICSDILLRHLYRTRIYWFCLRCHQEMPNFNLIKFNNIQKKNRSSEQYLKTCKNSVFISPIKNIYQAIQYQSSTIDLFVNQNKNRLEVIDFILKNIDLLLVNTYLEHQRYAIATESSSNKLKYEKFQNITLAKAKFLRESEIILLFICQAILVADKSILNNVVYRKLILNPLDLTFQIEKIYFIDLIKTLVIDFIKSISLDSAPKIDCFSSEISGYFEIVVSLMISPVIA